MNETREQAAAAVGAAARGMACTDNGYALVTVNALSVVMTTPDEHMLHALEHIGRRRGARRVHLNRVTNTLVLNF